jgi:hypothetical protein
VIPVTSNQADPGLGKGAVPGNISEWTGDTAFLRRAILLRGVYKSTIQAADSARNTTTCTTTVSAPTYREWHPQLAG